MTVSVAERFRLLKADFDQYGGGDYELAAALAGLAHQMPLVGAMTSRHFDDIADFLSKGTETSRAYAARRRSAAPPRAQTPARPDVRTP